MEQCKRIAEMAFDVCTEAVKRHTGFPFVFQEQAYWCRHYSDVLHVQCNLDVERQREAQAPLK